MSLDIKRKEMELARVTLARQEMELRIAEREEEIKRLQDNIKIQLAAEEKINTELKALKG